MVRRIRNVAIWALISILMQIGFLYYLERQIKQDAQASQKPPQPVLVQLSATIPEADVRNPQASFEKDYVVYSDNQGFKVYNLKLSKVVFTENKPAKGDILSYQWLPDRNTLLFIVARPNPNPRPEAKPEPKPEPKIDPKSPGHKPEDETVKEDPQAPPQEKPQPYYNPQLTELYAVDFAKPDEDSKPDRKLGRTLDAFPAGSIVQGMEVSTFTNLIYLQVKTGTSQIVYEIDVMRNIRSVQRSGEKIARMEVSDKKGTLYLQSVLQNVSQIVAVKHDGREQVLKGQQYNLLGVADGKVLVGEVENNRLTKIISLEDIGSQEKSNGRTKVEWVGDLPWKSYLIRTDSNFLALFDTDKALVFDEWKRKTVNLTGARNYPTGDGREVMELTPNGNGTTQIVFKPL